eukprot:NODE_9_length_47730_cov_0.323718.p27 type:complete len:137 gc:universal NODE_9_length_47730_cov_0.323718:8280-7870(-)
MSMFMDFMRSAQFFWYLFDDFMYTLLIIKEFLKLYIFPISLFTYLQDPFSHLYTLSIGFASQFGNCIKILKSWAEFGFVYKMPLELISISASMDFSTLNFLVKTTIIASHTPSHVKYNNFSVSRHSCPNSGSFKSL